MRKKCKAARCAIHDIEKSCCLSPLSSRSLCNALDFESQSLHRKNTPIVLEE